MKALIIRFEFLRAVCSLSVSYLCCSCYKRSWYRISHRLVQLFLVLVQAFASRPVALVHSMEFTKRPRALPSFTTNAVNQSVDRIRRSHKCMLQPNRQDGTGSNNRRIIKSGRFAAPTGSVDSWRGTKTHRDENAGVRVQAVRVLLRSHRGQQGKLHHLPVRVWRRRERAPPALHALVPRAVHRPVAHDQQTVPHLPRRHWRSTEFPSCSSLFVVVAVAVAIAIVVAVTVAVAIVVGCYVVFEDIIFTVQMSVVNV